MVNIVSQKNHDLLLFVISSHGDADGVILDSDCEEISLLSIFAEFFGNKCNFMLNKPKIFFVDACRGSMKSRIKMTDSKKTKQESSNLVLDTMLEESEKQQPSIHKFGTNDDQKTLGIAETKHVSGHSGSGVRYNHGMHSRQKAAPKDLYHNETNCRFVFAHADGYAAVDGGSKGGYLIQSIKHVFNKKNNNVNENLDSIVNQIRSKTRKLVGIGTGIMQNVQDATI